MEQTQIGTGPGVQQFLDCLEASGLVSAEEFERATQLPLGTNANGLALAQLLVASGVLTSYQAEVIYKQKPAELRIGNYDVLDRLGAGGMGTVFKARHRRMKRIVALKVLSRSLAKDESFVQRFQREVETIARFTHPNIVMAYDADEAEVGHFLVMEFVDGQDLASLVQKQGPLSVAVAVNCLLQTARGLEYAHNQGLIHRDVKPANLLCDAAGTVKITDLGLARFASAGRAEARQLNYPSGCDSRHRGLHASRTSHRRDRDRSSRGYLQPRGDAPLSVAEPAALSGGIPGGDHVQTQARADPVAEGGSSGSSRRARRDLSRHDGQGSRRADPDDGRSRASAGSRRGQPARDDYDRCRRTRRAQIDARRTTVVPVESKRRHKPGDDCRGSNDVQSSSRSSGLPGPLSVKVLLVEPSRTQSGIIRKYLQGQGVKEIVTAASGKDALEAFRTARPDAIVSALHLPDMTGVQLAQQVREEAKASAPALC